MQLLEVIAVLVLEVLVFLDDGLGVVEEEHDEVVEEVGHVRVCGAHVLDVLIVVVVLLLLIIFLGICGLPLLLCLLQ